jgi:hypothetical protein
LQVGFRHWIFLLGWEKEIAERGIYRLYSEIIYGNLEGCMVGVYLMVGDGCGEKGIRE